METWQVKKYDEIIYKKKLVFYCVEKSAFY